MIRKTVKDYMRFISDFEKGSRILKSTHTIRILRETWWFLFIPVYSREKILSSNL
jgi:hypothetical protein